MSESESHVSRSGSPRAATPDELVREIHARRAAGESARERKLLDALLRLLEPRLRRQARRFAPLGGSLLEDDLVQVALLEALKSVGKYLAEERGGQTFATWVEWRARRAILDVIRMHGSDVHPSDRAQRGRKVKGKRTEKVRRTALLMSRDEPSEVLPGSLTEQHDAALALEVGTIEELCTLRLECARLRREVLKLDPKLRELLAHVHGLGQEARSVRQLAREWNEPRGRLDAMLAQAHEQLRERLAGKAR